MEDVTKATEAGYKSYLISTIVDKLCFHNSMYGYKSYLISTIVDLLRGRTQPLGYKSYLISTIVDKLPLGLFSYGL